MEEKTAAEETTRSGVKINSSHAEETDEVVSAGQCYPIYSYSANPWNPTWVCPACDAENSEQVKVCGVCGAARPAAGVPKDEFPYPGGTGGAGGHKETEPPSGGEGPGKPDEPKKPKKKRGGILVVLAVALAALAAAAVLLLGQGSRPANTPAQTSSSRSVSSSSSRDASSESSSVTSDEPDSEEPSSSEEPASTSVPDSKPDSKPVSSSSGSSSSTPASSTTPQVPSYTVSYKVSGSGSLTGGSSSGKSSLQYTVKQNEGKSFTVTAVPGNNYHFVRWSDGSTSATRTDTNFTQNVTFTAYFEQNEPAPSYTASASQDGNGVITFTLNAEGQTVDISMELVQTATGKSYSLGKIGSFGSGSYRFDPACPGDPGEYQVRFYDQNRRMLASVHVVY